MPPSDEELAAFEAALRAKVSPKEESTAENPEAEAVSAETDATAAERVRDDKGRFVKQDESQLESQNESPEELILGRFKDEASLVKSYQELERKLTEQGQEVGELRKLRADFESLRQALAAPDDYDPAEFESHLERDPAHAAQLAYQAGDQHGLARAWKEWSEQDPASAAVWLSDIRMQGAITSMRNQYEQQVGPLAAENQNSQIARGWQAVARRHPDISEFGESLFEAAKSAPEIVQALKAGTSEVAERVFENLYWMTKGRQGDSLKEAVQQAATQSAEELRQAKIQATVATASSAPGEEEKSAKERFKEALLQSGRPSIQEELYRTSTRQ